MHRALSRSIGKNPGGEESNLINMRNKYVKALRHALS